MKILSLYNIKGGVGKTASSVNLAYLCARDGYRTLLWDLDPQGASTFYYRIKPKIKGGSKQLISGKKELDDKVKATDFENLDLLPADFSYRNMDLVLEDAKKPTKQLTRLLRPMREDYDFVFLDCPPSISLVSENVFRASDALLIPSIPTTLSQRTYMQLLDFLQGHGLSERQRIPFFSMVDRRKRMHTDIVSGMADEYPEFLDNSIPYASDVERMGLERRPVVNFATSSPAAKAYMAMWDEIKERLYI